METDEDMAKRLQSEEDSKMAQALADADAGKKPSDSSDSSDDDIPDLEDKLTDEEKAAKARATRWRHNLPAGARVVPTDPSLVLPAVHTGHGDQGSRQRSLQGR